MSTPRVFIPSNQIHGERVTIHGSDVHHLVDVLRCGVGDGLEIRDDRQRVYAAIIEHVEKGRLLCRLEGVRNLKSEPSLQVTLAQGIPKGGKFDAIIRQTTELGVHSIIPVTTERSIPHLSTKLGEGKLERWRKIAKSAAEQSGRLMIPAVQPIATFARVLENAKKFDVAVLFSEMEGDTTLKSILRGRPSLQTAILLIGPEGGFSQSEVVEAQNAGFQSVTLGRRILRTETAPIAALAMILYEKDL